MHFVVLVTCVRFARTYNNRNALLLYKSRVLCNHDRSTLRSLQLSLLPIYHCAQANRSFDTHIIL